MKAVQGRTRILCLIVYLFGVLRTLQASFAVVGDVTRNGGTMSSRANLNLGNKGIGSRGRPSPSWPGFRMEERRDANGIDQRHDTATTATATTTASGVLSVEKGEESTAPTKSTIMPTAATVETDDATASTTSDESQPPPPKYEKTADVLSLDSIRSTLIRQEETIIFALIERAQWRTNSIVYDPRGFGVDLKIPLGSSGLEDDIDGGGRPPLSFLEHMLISTEVMHCAVRRYTSPEEHAFFPQYLPPAGQMNALPTLDYPIDDLLSSINAAADVNFNANLLHRYLHDIVPSITRRGDDEQHGSSVLCDVAALQALSKRVHYGKFVAESKFRQNPEQYQALVEADDSEGVMELLTNREVEKKILQRIRLKAANYGREPLQLLPALDNLEEEGGFCRDERDATCEVAAAAAATAVAAALESMQSEGGKKKKKWDGKVDPAVMERIYREIVIPLTKDIEVAYLYLRCGREPPKKYRPAPHQLRYQQLQQQEQQENEKE